MSPDEVITTRRDPALRRAIFDAIVGYEPPAGASVQIPGLPEFVDAVEQAVLPFIRRVERERDERTERLDRITYKLGRGLDL